MKTISKPRWRAAAACSAVALVLTSCNSAASSPSPETRTAGTTSGSVPPSTDASSGASATAAADELKAVDVTTGLTSPWGMAFLADGSALLSERDTKDIVRVEPGGTKTRIATIPEAEPSGEGGLLGLAIAKDEKTVFVYYTSADDNRVVAMDWDGEKLGSQREIIGGIPESGRHNGGQLAIGPDGFLYVATGDAAESEQSQDEKSLAGKILRVTVDGDPAPDNPYDNEVFSIGHRNVQGLAFDDQGRLWASEFGDQTWDELNLIKAGGNYGWPAAEGSSQVDGMINPLLVWSTADASPSGLAYWDGSLWMAGLRGMRLWEIPITGDTTGDPIAHFADTYGRLRGVKVTPDGDGLWLSTSNTDGRNTPKSGDDRILKITRS